MKNLVLFFLQNFGNFCRSFSKNILGRIGIAIFLLLSGEIPHLKKYTPPQAFSNSFQFYVVLRDWWKFPIFCQFFLNLQYKNENFQFFLVFWFQDFDKFFQISINLFQIKRKKNSPFL